LLERLLVAHESYELIRKAWLAEAERRMEKVRAGEMKLIPLEDALADPEETADSMDRPPPLMPRAIEDIEDEALHLGHDDFYALLVNVEAELPPDVDPAWRADIRTRIQAVPVAIERRYREQEENCGGPGGHVDLG
jgi:hypothetical protein